MADEFNPQEIGETPKEFIENEDGSVEIPLDDETSMDEADTEFLANLAEQFNDSVLNSLSSELVELVDKDKESRKKRDEQYEEGLRRTGLGDDAPGGAEFDGASRVVHPVLAEACVDFSSRAIKELFPAAGPVKPWVNGSINAAKLERANRKTRYMNWQLTTQIKEYRDELEQLLTQLPMGGSQYQKFWRDDKKKRICCEFVAIDEIFLPYSATSFYNAARITHRQLISRSTFKRRVKSGLYRDVFIGDSNRYPDSSATSRANDKIEGREEDGYNDDGLRAILEIYCYEEFDDDDITDGESAPYIITIDEDTEKVLAIYRNWDENDPLMEKLEWMVEWKFIPWRGAYAIGLPHLIGGLSAALTGSLRALLDSAHINNAPTMLKLKSGRIVGQNTQVNVTQVCDIEGPAGVDDIRKLAMAMPFNPPSPVLFQLMQDLYGLAKGVIATAEDKIAQVGDRTPVGTTMALIEQGSNTYSAIHARLHESQKRALAIVHRLNATYMDDDEGFEDEPVSREDFQGSLDVIPVSDPTIFSEAQRFAQSQAVLQMAAQDAPNPNIPWNQVKVRRRMLKQMRIDDIDELLPAPKSPTTADPITETDVALKGDPLKAEPTQDHLAHIKTHLAMIASPWISQNPLIPPQVIQNILQHINEHILMLQTETIAQVAHQMLIQAQNQGIPASPEQLSSIAVQQASQQLGAQLQPITQQISQLQQELQKRTPQPPMPPEVQASIQIAQMDIQRKTQMDQATLQANQANQQAKQQLDNANLQLKQTQQQFDQRMEQVAQQFDQFITTQEQQASARNDELTKQVELMRNKMDNEQHQMTELLKNHEDNQTNIFIERMKQELASVPALQEKPQEVGGPDLSPQLEKLTSMMDQLSKQRTDDALTSVMEGLRATVEHLGRPKMLIRDAQGKAQGIQ